MTRPMSSTKTARSGASRIPKTSMMTSTENTAAASANPMRKMDAVKSPKSTTQMSTRISSRAETALTSALPRIIETTPNAVVHNRTTETTTGKIFGPTTGV